MNISLILNCLLDQSCLPARRFSSFPNRFSRFNNGSLGLNIYSPIVSQNISHIPTDAVLKFQWFPISEPLLSLGKYLSISGRTLPVHLNLCKVIQLYKRGSQKMHSAGDTLPSYLKWAGWLHGPPLQQYTVPCSTAESLNGPLQICIQLSASKRRTFRMPWISKSVSISNCTASIQVSVCFKNRQHS